jgi:hypothetical protein
MNFKEGTRRFALLVGCLGSIAGGFGSYLEMKPAIKQKAAHDRFERLATSDVVQKERKCRLLGHESGCSNADPSGWEVVDVSPISAKAKQEDDFADIAKPLPSNVPRKFDMKDAIPIPSEINTDEIQTINWGIGKVSRAEQNQASVAE